jgi:drug/metabolite transporter (DMT)-like permease
MTRAGELAALGTAACWATGSNLFAAAGRRFGPAVLNRLRLTLALVMLGLTLAVLRGHVWPVWATPAQLGWLAASGLVGYVFGDINYFRSLVALGPSRTQMVSSLAPVFTALLAWPVLGETPGPLALLGMALTLAGILVVLAEHRRLRPDEGIGLTRAGVIAGTLGAVGQAGGFVLSKFALRTGIDPVSATVVRAAAAVLAVWLLALPAGEVRSSWAALADRRGSLLMAGGAFLGPYLGVMLALAALQRVEAGVVASIIAFSPVIAIVMAARFHREPITARILLGALISVAGVVVLFLR